MFAWILAIGLAFANNAQDESVSLAFRLVQDGNYIRARAVLDSIDNQQVDADPQAARYYAALGLVLFQEQNPGTV